MDLQSLFQKKSLFASRKVGHELILVPIKNNVANMNELFTLNEVGSFIWEQLDGIKTKEEIIQLLANEFEVDAVTATNDTDEFILQLHHIIESL